MTVFSETCWWYLSHLTTWMVEPSERSGMVSSSWVSSIALEDGPVPGRQRGRGEVMIELVALPVCTPETHAAKPLGLGPAQVPGFHGVEDPVPGVVSRAISHLETPFTGAVHRGTGHRDAGGRGPTEAGDAPSQGVDAGWITARWNRSCWSSQ